VFKDHAVLDGPSGVVEMASLRPCFVGLDEDGLVVTGKTSFGQCGKLGSPW